MGLNQGPYLLLMCIVKFCVSPDPFGLVHVPLREESDLKESGKTVADFTQPCAFSCCAHQERSRCFVSGHALSAEGLVSKWPNYP